MNPNGIVHFLLLAAVLLVNPGGAIGQAGPDKWEPDEYGFPSISCGGDKATYEYESRSGEKILVVGQKYGSPALADEALEKILKTATEVLERHSPVNDRQGPRFVAKFPKKALIVERIGTWLYSTEAASLDSLMRFDDYEKKRLSKINQ